MRVSSFFIDAITNHLQESSTLTYIIDEVLEFLALDNALHTTKEISGRLQIPHNTCMKIIIFLLKYDLIELEGLRIKLNPKIKNFVIATTNKEHIDNRIFPLPTITKK